MLVNNSNNLPNIFLRSTQHSNSKQLAGSKKSKADAEVILQLQL